MLSNFELFHPFTLVHSLFTPHAAFESIINMKPKISKIYTLDHVAN